MLSKKLPTIFSQANKLILNTLFPVCCVSCGKEGRWICERCLSRIPLRIEHVCGVCEKAITPDGRTCLSCKKKNALDGLVIATSYKNSSVARAVHLYKYRFVPDLHIELGDLIIKALQKTDIPLADIIIPIPLHPKRLRWRGFNQSALLAKHIAANLLPQSQLVLGENILIRNRYTPPQMGIDDYKARQQNIEGAFGVADAESIKNKIVLLVDDIATTGSTIFECARVLKAAGAAEVYAAVVARQEVGKN